MNGENLFNLIILSQDWVHRRVDKIHLTSAGRTRKLVSVDFTVPNKYAIKASHGKCVVPIAMLSKQPQRAFDVKSASGTSLPVLNTPQHAKFVVPMLFAALIACRIRSVNGKNYDEKLATNLITAHKGEGALKAESEFLESLDFRHADIQLETFARKFIETLRDSYILLIELDRRTLGCRTLVKYSYDEEELPRRSKSRKTDLPHRLRNELAVEQNVPDPGFARSQHIELWVPDDLELGSASLAWRFGKGTSVERVTERERNGQRIAHVSTSRIDRFCDARAFFVLRPIKTGLSAVATIALVAFCGTVALGTLIMNWPPETLLGKWVIPSPAASIILIAPAILLSWLARPPENSLVYQALFPLRLLVGLIALGFLLLAGAAALPLSTLTWKSIWCAIWLLTASCIYIWVRWGRYRKGTNNLQWDSAGIS